MKIDKLTIEGFGSYKNFELDFTDAKLFGILGNSGAGKSTIGNAISWCMFGKTAEGIKTEDVINDNSKECKVKIEGANDLSIPFKLERFRKRSSSGEKVTFATAPEGKFITTDQSQINSFFHFSEAIFNNAIFLSQGRASRLLSSGETEQKNIIEAILNVNLDAFEKHTKEKMTKMENEIRLNTSETLRIKTVIDTLEKNMKQEEERTKEVDHSKEIKLLKDRISDLIKRNGQIIVEVNTIENRRIPLESVELEHSNKLKQISDITTEIGRLQGVSDPKPLDTRCVSCAVYTDILAEKQKLMLQRDQLNHQLSNLRTELNVISVKRNDSLKTNQEIARLKSEQLHIKATIESAQRTIEQLSKTVESSQGAINNYKKQIEINKENLGINTKQYDELISVYNCLKFWKEGFGNQGIKNFLMDIIKPKLQYNINKYLSRLFIFPVKIDIPTLTEKDSEFKINIYRRDNQVKYKTFSYGERDKLDVAALFGIRQSILEVRGIELSFLFLDDILNPLDYQTQERVIEVLKEELRLNKVETIVITDPKLSSLENTDIRQYCDYYLILDNVNGETVVKE